MGMLLRSFECFRLRGAAGRQRFFFFQEFNAVLSLKGRNACIHVAKKDLLEQKEKIIDNLLMI